MRGEFKWLLLVSVPAWRSESWSNSIKTPEAEGNQQAKKKKFAYKTKVTDTCHDKTSRRGKKEECLPGPGEKARRRVGQGWLGGVRVRCVPGQLAGSWQTPPVGRPGGVALKLGTWSREEGRSLAGMNKVDEAASKETEAVGVFFFLFFSCLGFLVYCSLINL